MQEWGSRQLRFVPGKGLQAVQVSVKWGLQVLQASTGVGLHMIQVSVSLGLQAGWVTGSRAAWSPG